MSEDSEPSILSLPQIPKDVLQDLCSRFLINIPDNEKNDMVRICFQIELAHWYYVDFCRQYDPDLPGCGMKAFISIIFSEFSFLNKTKQSINSIYENWKKYKVRVPVFGAILLDETLEKCLLVQGFHNKTSWGFPKGKVNKDEGDLACAIREVWEEVGYDITPLALGDQFLENNIHDHQVRLYIVPGVDEKYQFKPNTRGEIKEIKWFKVNHLPTHKKDSTPKEEIGLMANNFFMIHTFIKPLRKWITDKKNSMSSLMFSTSMSHLYQPSYSHHSPTSKSKKEEEQIEQWNRQRHEREAAEYKRMHDMMNPFRVKEVNEDTLKVLLGMKDSSSNITHQPEAIRKLLTGTVQISPVITPQKPSKFSSPTSSTKNAMGTDFPVLQQSPNEFLNRTPRSGKKERTKNYAESYAQKASRGLAVQKDSPIGYERSRCFVPVSQPQQTRNSPNYQTRSPPGFHRSRNSPGNYTKQDRSNNIFTGSARKLNYHSSSPGKQQRHNDNNQTTGLLSDFNFSSAAFTSFKFNYDQILSALM